MCVVTGHIELQGEEHICQLACLLFPLLFHLRHQAARCWSCPRVTLPSQEVCLPGDSNPTISHHKYTSGQGGWLRAFECCSPWPVCGNCIWLNSCFLKCFCSKSRLLIVSQIHKLNCLIKFIYPWLALSVFKRGALSLHPQTISWALGA